MHLNPSKMPQMHITLECEQHKENDLPLMMDMLIYRAARSRNKRESHHTDMLAMCSWMLTAIVLCLAARPTGPQTRMLSNVPLYQLYPCCFPSFFPWLALDKHDEWMTS
jgi:hypothetical protein